MNVRPAGPGDLGVLAEIGATAYQADGRRGDPPLSGADLVKYVARPRHHVVMAETITREPLGYAAFGDKRDGHYTVDRLVVRPDRRREGTGSILAGHVLRLAARKRLLGVQMFVDERDERGVAFWRHQDAVAELRPGGVGGDDRYLFTMCVGYPDGD